MDANHHKIQWLADDGNTGPSLGPSAAGEMNEQDVAAMMEGSADAPANAVVWDASGTAHMHLPFGPNFIHPHLAPFLLFCFAFHAVGFVLACTTTTTNNNNNNDGDGRHHVDQRLLVLRPRRDQQVQQLGRGQTLEIRYVAPPRHTLSIQPMTLLLNTH